MTSSTECDILGSMSMDPAKLRDEVLRLPLEARARLVDELLHSLDDDDEIDQAEHTAAWGAEIAERLRAVDAGEVQPVPWSEARQRIARER
jgi:putative addiction module component (TIGR02574 family)